MATRTQNRFYGEHVLGYALIEDSHLSNHARLLSAYLAGFGLRDTASPSDARICQALDIDVARLSQIKAEIHSDSNLWKVTGETKTGSVYTRTVDPREALSLPTGWRADWRADLGRQAGMRWLARYSIEETAHTIILLSLSLSLSIEARQYVRVTEEQFDLMDCVRDLEETLTVLRDRGFIEFTWTQNAGLLVRWSSSFSGMLREYTRSWFAPKVGGIDAETAYGLDRWAKVGREIRVVSDVKTWDFYTLSDPRTQQIRYAGITADAEYRRLNHYGSGMQIESRSQTNSRMAEWLVGLREEGLEPRMVVHTYLSVTGTRAEAERVEGEWVRSLHAAGCALLNIEHLLTSPRS